MNSVGIVVDIIAAGKNMVAVEAHVGYFTDIISIVCSIAHMKSPNAAGS